MRKAVYGEGLTEPLGAYSNAVWAGPTLYISGEGNRRSLQSARRLLDRNSRDRVRPDKK